MAYQFGKRSRANLDTCDEGLQRIAERALSYGVMDFSVIEGRRTRREQYKLYQDGKSQLDGYEKKSKHNHLPSQAMDLLPYPPEVNGVNVWSDKQRFAVLAGLIYAAASEEDIAIRWGGDWSGNGNNADSSFFDAVHFELLDT